MADSAESTTPSATSRRLRTSKPESASDNVVAGPAQPTGNRTSTKRAASLAPASQTPPTQTPVRAHTHPETSPVATDPAPKSALRKRWGRKQTSKTELDPGGQQGGDPEVSGAGPVSAERTASGDPEEGTAGSTHAFFRIVLIEGKNLVPADNLNRGEPSSDPYVVMNLCDPDGNRIPRATAKSSVITKSLNPYWGEEHILPVPKSMLSKFRNRGPLLELGVFDSDGKMQKDDFLGGYTLDLRHRQANTPRRYPWMSDVNGKSTFDWPTGGDDDPRPGRIPHRDGFDTLYNVTKVVMQLGLYTKCSGDRADARRCNDPDCKAGHPMFSIVGNGSTKTVEKAFKQRDGHIGSLVVKIQRIPDEDVVTPVDKDAWIKSTKLISITPIECFHLRPRKEATVKKVVEGGSMQVVCKMKIGKPGRELVRKTAVAKVKASAGLVAKFREAHEFYVKGMYRFLTISIVDKAANEAKEGLLARTCVDCGGLSSEGGPLLKVLAGFEPSVKPEMTFNLSMEEMFADSDEDRDSEEEFSAEQRPRINSFAQKRSSSVKNKVSVAADFGNPAAIITVEVKQGRNLTAKDRSVADKSLGRLGTSDPFCFVEIQHKRKRTPTVSKDLNPVWNSTLKFRVYDLFSPIKLKVFDEDIDSKGLSKMEFLGQCIVPMHHVKSGEDEWLALRAENGFDRMRGELLVAIHIKMRRKKDETRLSWLQYYDSYILQRRLVDQRDADRLRAASLAAVGQSQTEVEENGDVHEADTDVDAVQKFPDYPMASAVWNWGVEKHAKITNLTLFTTIKEKALTIDAKIDPLGNRQLDELGHLELGDSPKGVQKYYRCAKLALAEPKSFSVWLISNYDPFDYFGMSGYWTALRYAIAVPADLESDISGTKKFKLKMIGTAVNRLKVQIASFVGCTKIVTRALNWDYGTPITLLLMILWCWVCLFAEFWILPLPIVIIFAYTWFTDHHSSDERVESYRMDYIDDEDSSSDEDEGEDEEESTGDAPSAGLRKKIRKYLQLAATVQNSLARVASYLERVVSLFTWKAPMITEALVIGLVALSIVLMMLPLHLVLLAGVMFVWIDKGREKFNLKPAKKKKMKKKSGGNPLPLDILERLPDKLITRQLRRLEPKSISRMTALANARGSLTSPAGGEEAELG